MAKVTFIIITSVGQVSVREAPGVVMCEVPQLQGAPLVTGQQPQVPSPRGQAQVELSA